MTIIDKFAGSELLFSTQKRKGFTLRTKLLIGMIPSVMIILLITGYTTYLTSSHFLNQALERTSRVQVRSMAHEIETVIKNCAQTVKIIAQQSPDRNSLGDYLAIYRTVTGMDLRSLGFISQKDGGHLFYVAKDGYIAQISGASISEILPDPLLNIEPFANLKPKEVWMSQVMEVLFPFPSPESPNQKIQSRIVYFGTPYISGSGETSGYLLLGLDVRELRNVLSLFNSTQSPIWAFPRTPEVRFAYLFDLNGWMLFESEAVERPEMELTTDLARSSYAEGTLGRPGLPSAFRPASIYQPFWKMIGDVNDGKFDLIELSGPGRAQGGGLYLAYAPVIFQGTVVAGVAYIDRTRHSQAAGYKHVDIMLILSLATILVVSLIIFFLSHRLTKPIYQLSEAVNDIQNNRKLKPIDIGSSGYEANLLEHAINNMISAISIQLAELKLKEIRIQSVEHKEKIELKTNHQAISKTGPSLVLPEIIGYGERIEQVKSEIMKAAAAEEDVLIVGETGTGKQLAAEAIHRHSRRASYSFISVNCGELAENLLIDSLFGHVKGAFTEAKTDRKGAFLEAHGGTLFLDEIQTASPTVQQALLRAVAMRKIKQLGSDRDLDVDVRLITATNVDLRVLIENRQFRNDLYYRLKVITLYIPSLRNQKETIPAIVDHFLTLSRESTGRRNLGISRGAMEKIGNYHWPGNIRELKNCITRAAVMSENDIIQAEDIFLDGEFHVELSRLSTFSPKRNGIHHGGMMMPEKQPVQDAEPQDPGGSLPDVKGIDLSPRQRKAYSQLGAKKSITRNEYQYMAGEKMSSRTAIYDLQDMVNKGILVKEGKGPATRYVLKE